MIFGIGTDLVDIRRIEKVYARFGETFLKRILNLTEQQGLRSHPSLPRLLAKRFAAKEACAKAMRTGISKNISWHDMTILHENGTRPEIHLSERAQHFLHSHMNGTPHIQLDLSLSDEYPYIQAFVIVSYFYQENR